MLRQLTLASLCEVNEAFAMTVDNQIKQIVEDCEDRPGDKTARVLTIKVSFLPIASARDLDSIDVQLKSIPSLPAVQTAGHNMAPRRGGILAFNPFNADDVDQQTFFDGEKSV